MCPLPRHMQEMIDKYDPTKNASADNKKNKRHAGVLAQVLLPPSLRVVMPFTVGAYAPSPACAARAQAKQRERQLAKMEEEGLVADPDAKQDEATIAISFPPPPPLKRPDILKLQDCAFGYSASPGASGGAGAGAGGDGAPPPSLLLRELNLSLSMGERVGVLGANGCGKSTLLRLLTQELEPTKGEAWLNRGVRWALFAQHHVDQVLLPPPAPNPPMPMRVPCTATPKSHARPPMPNAFAQCTATPKNHARPIHMPTALSSSRAFPFVSSSSTCTRRRPSSCSRASPAQRRPRCARASAGSHAMAKPQPHP